jgi:undecaprenyl-diphosphatase
MPGTGNPPSDATANAHGRRNVCRLITIHPATIALTIFVTIVLTLVARGPSVLPGDVAAARWLQRWDFPGLAQLVEFANAFGSAKVAIPFSAVLVFALLLAHHRMEAMIMVAISVIRPLNAVLKALCDSPRPSGDLLRIDQNVNGLGYPSGHAMGITLFCGAVIWITCRLTSPGWRQRVIILSATGLILLTGFARVYVGAHWPSDVLGGYLWGTTLLLLVYAGFTWFERRHGRLVSQERDGRPIAPGIVH